MQASSADSVTLLVEQALSRHLTCGLASTLRYRKSRNSVNAIACLAQRIERFAQPESQWADHACGHHRDAGSELFPIRASGFNHLLGKEKMIPDSYCFLKRSILLVKRDGKTEARQLVDCQLSLFSGDLKSDKREQ